MHLTFDLEGKDNILCVCTSPCKIMLPRYCDLVCLHWDLDI